MGAPFSDHSSLRLIKTKALVMEYRRLKKLGDRDTALILRTELRSRVKAKKKASNPPVRSFDSLIMGIYGVKL